MLTKIKQFLLPFGLLAGTIIGAGVFSLPYLFKFSGLTLGFFYLALASFVYVVLYRMYADIIKETPGEHRFVGFARIYLGRYASWLAFLIAVVEGILVLTIYLILSKSFFDLFIRFGAPIEHLIVFWFIGSAVLLVGLKKISRLELAATLGIIAIFLLIFLWGVPSLDTFSVPDFRPVWGNFFILLAPVLFSLSGRAAIPGVVRLGGPTKAVITWGVIIPALLYALFAVSVVAISPIVTEDAVTGLRAGLPLWFGGLIGILGLLSLITSYVAVGYDVDRTLELDLKISGWWKFAVVMFGPIFLYFAGLQDFLGAVGLAGGIFIALESILIVWMWLKMRGKKMSAMAAALIILFATALVYEIMKTLG